MSLSTRIALGVALVLTLTLVVLGATMVSATRSTLTDEIDQRLIMSKQRAEEFMPRHINKIFRGDVTADGPADDGPGEPDGARRETEDALLSPGRDVVITIPDGGIRDRGRRNDEQMIRDIAGRDVALIVVGPEGKHLFEMHSGYDEVPDSPPALPPDFSGPPGAPPRRLMTLPSEDGAMMYRVLLWTLPGGITVADAESLQPVDDAVNRLMRNFGIAGGLALALASLVSWWVIKQELRPVDQMVETAAAIADGDLSRRVPEADPETELGRLGEALNEMLGQIEAGIREREATEGKLRRFVADAAHELRTPLTSLRGYAELYRKGALPTTDAVGNAMGRIESEGARMARLVDDLLLLARTDQGRALEKEPVDLVRLARDAAGDFAAADPERPLQRELDGSAVVVGDPIRLRQAIDNLLVNVRSHTPATTPARVSVQRNGAWVEVTVADDGPGIPEEDQPRIFERFWRGDPSRGRTGAGGAGLGLSIVDALVRAHGGTVSVKSKPGQGTAFTLRLPLAHGVGSQESGVGTQSERFGVTGVTHLRSGGPSSSDFRLPTPD
jgi:two-component system OmpR family sensor kinase